MKNRHDLEEAIGWMAQLPNDIDTIIYAVGDAPEPPTEDELLNMLIGVKQLHETRYQKMWSTFEELIKQGNFK
jgi:hypothetical protein